MEITKQTSKTIRKEIRELRSKIFSREDELYNSGLSDIEVDKIMECEIYKPLELLKCELLRLENGERTQDVITMQKQDATTWLVSIKNNHEETQYVIHKSDGFYWCPDFSVECKLLKNVKQRIIECHYKNN